LPHRYDRREQQDRPIGQDGDASRAAHAGIGAPSAAGAEELATSLLPRQI
jgi:hypothetical protein